VIRPAALYQLIDLQHTARLRIGKRDDGLTVITECHNADGL
jgi:hypothetical protein